MLRELTDRAHTLFNDPQTRLNYMREQMQRIILTSLHEAGSYRNIAFVGGTCLRVAHGLRRYSEDLDFSLIENNNYDFPSFLRKTAARLNALGVEHTIKINTKKVVHAAWIGFPQIRQMIGEHPMADAKLSIKLEVDTNPPLGWNTEQHIQRSEYGLAALTTYDLPSLFAGKLHALCCRKYTKGRDWYDLVWYLAKHPPIIVNEQLLTNAVAQTEGDRAWPGEHWREKLAHKIQRLDVNSVKADIAPFLERPEELALFTRETLEKQVEQ